MPEPKNPKPRTTRQKTTATQPTQEKVCHIHDDVSVDEIHEIHENVCVPHIKYPLSQFHGKYYCLFHKPTKDKDIGRFEEIFKEKLLKIDELINYNELKREEKSFHNKIVYDFRFIWFPRILNLSEHKFNGEVHLTGATFSKIAFFNDCNFEESSNFSFTHFFEDAVFGGAKFKKSVRFVNTHFNQQADFIKCEFKDYILFSNVIFDEDTNFNYAKFEEFSQFSSVIFRGETEFISTEFLTFGGFISSKFFSKVLFLGTKFNGNIIFSRSKFFKECIFGSAIFTANASFIKTSFRDLVSFHPTKIGANSHIFFTQTIFANKVEFDRCVSEGYLNFQKIVTGSKAIFSLNDAAFEKASRVSFHTVRLEPNWFVNVDSRKFVFTDIDWGKTIEWKSGRSFIEQIRFAAKCVVSGFRQLFWKSDEILSTNIDDELKRLEERGIKKQNKRLLEIACRQLAVNAEENNRYGEASQFRYMAMETKRLENKGIWRFLNLHWVYKWTSCYGESWRRALVVLLGLLLLFSLVYISPVATFDHGEKKKEFVNDAVERQIFDVADTSERFKSLSLGESVYYSLAVSALQKPEPKPADSLTKILVILQTILAPLQAALLALAIRRKFMR